jgi:hypothetical protein
MRRVVIFAGWFPLALLVVLFFHSYRAKVRPEPLIGNMRLPPVMLWAWERPVDLEYLDTGRYGVAFLAQTLSLKGDEVVLTPRRQPLHVTPETKLMAVTRIESEKNGNSRASLSASQRERVLELILRSLELDNISAIQVDFDAVTSEREFYRQLLRELRQKLPQQIPLSMTALASFCVGDRWLHDLPVDEAVPMIFRMGPDDRRIKSMLANGYDFREPLCRRSYGIAVDEPFAHSFNDGRRLYVFNPRPWTGKEYAALEEGRLK